jgi:hypothetical protein
MIGGEGLPAKSSAAYRALSGDWEDLVRVCVDGLNDIARRYIVKTNSWI